MEYGPEAPHNYSKRMVRPWVELAESQYEQLNELREKASKPVSEMIREAVSNFVRKKEYSINIGASHLPRTSRENYRRVTTYLSRSDLSLLASISKETGRCKTHLIREAVDEYLGGAIVSRGKRGMMPCNRAQRLKSVLWTCSPRTEDLQRRLQKRKQSPS